MLKSIFFNHRREFIAKNNHKSGSNLNFSVYDSLYEFDHT